VSGQQQARSTFPPGIDPAPILRKAGWAPGSVFTGGKSRPHRDSIPDRPARSSVAIPTELPGPHRVIYSPQINFTLVTIVYTKNIDSYTIFRDRMNRVLT